jgi:hypothetical protein
MKGWLCGICNRKFDEVTLLEDIAICDECIPEHELMEKGDGEDGRKIQSQTTDVSA